MRGPQNSMSYAATKLSRAVLRACCNENPNRLHPCPRSFIGSHRNPFSLIASLSSLSLSLSLSRVGTTNNKIPVLRFVPQTFIDFLTLSVDSAARSPLRSFRSSSRVRAFSFLLRSALKILFPRVKTSCSLLDKASCIPLSVCAVPYRLHSRVGDCLLDSHAFAQWSNIGENIYQRCVSLTTPRDDGWNEKLRHGRRQRYKSGPDAFQDYPRFVNANLIIVFRTGIQISNTESQQRNNFLRVCL